MKAATRIEVTDYSTGQRPRTTVWFVTEEDRQIARRHAAALDPIIDRALAGLGGVPDGATKLAALLVEAAADADAYEREAMRRGVLAL